MPVPALRGFVRPTADRRERAATGGAALFAGLLRQQLMHAAAQRGGRLSVSEGVMATGKDFAEVEAALDAMARSGYVGIDNHPETGVVVYVFAELGG